MRASLLACLEIPSLSGCLLGWLLGEYRLTVSSTMCLSAPAWVVDCTALALSITPQELQGSFAALAEDGKLSAAGIVKVQCFERK